VIEPKEYQHEIYTNSEKKPNLLLKGLLSIGKSTDDGPK
jgi:hypothetical protein